MPVAVAVTVAVAIATAACTAVRLVDAWQKLVQRLQILHHKPCNARTQSVSLTVRSGSQSHALWGRYRLALLSSHPLQFGAAEPTSSIPAAVM